MSQQFTQAPPDGERISIAGGVLQVPDRPDHPLHRGRRHRPGHLAGVACACSTPRWRRPTAASAGSPGWRSSPARRPSTAFGNWLPEETVEAFREFLVGIKGPLTTPIGGGIRSLNVALRQVLDLYVCLRPVRYFKGVPSPVKHPEKVDMVIFRENTEDIYAGIEFESRQPEAQQVFGPACRRIPEGLREDPLPRDRRASASSRSRARARERLVRAAIRYALDTKRQERHPGAQGQHHEVHRGRLPRLGLRAGRARVRAIGSTPGRSGSAPRQRAGRSGRQRRAEASAAGRASC